MATLRLDQSSQILPQCIPPLLLPPSLFSTSVNPSTSIQVASSPPVIELSCKKSLINLPSVQQLLVLSNLFCELLSNEYSVKVPSDFLKVAAEGMKHLDNCNRSNVIYLMARALGTARDDRSDSLLPAKRMRMGLIEHTVNFFNAEHVIEVCM